MILLLHGPNSYLSKERLKKIIADHGEEFGDEGITSFDGSRCEADMIFQGIDSISMFSRNKLIIVKNFSENKGQKRLVDIISSKDFTIPQNVSVVFFENKGADKRTAFYKLFKKKGKVEEFTNLAGAKLFSWINSEFKKRKIEANPDAIKTLIEYVGDEMWRMVGEIEKLSIFCEDCKVSIEDVQAIVPQSAAVKIWGLTDAIGEGNRRKALEMFEKLLKQGEDPIHIISLIIWQYRQLIQILYEVNRSRNASQISSDLKINPYIVRKVLSYANNLNLDNLKVIYYKLVDFDYGIKKSALDSRFAITLLLSAG